jgi:hypothetical protein
MEITIDTLAQPTVHLNGSGRRALIDQRTDCMTALAQALDAINKAWPHGRDYYVKEGSLAAAEKLWRSRYQAIVPIRDEIEQEAILLVDGGK